MQVVLAVFLTSRAKPKLTATKTSQSILNRTPSLNAIAVDFNQNLRFQYIIKNLKQLTQATENLMILDVGAGMGTLSNYLNQNSQVINLETGRKRKLNNQVIADGRKLPFSDKAFDVTVSSDVLEHLSVEDREGFLLEMLRCSKTGTIVTYSRIHTANPNRSAIKIFEALTRTQPDWYLEHNSNSIVEKMKVLAALETNGNVAVETPIVGFWAVALSGIIQNVPWRANLRAAANIAGYLVVRLIDRAPYYGFGVVAARKQAGEPKMRVLTCSAPSKHAPEMSIIVAPRLFPNRQLEEFIQSTRHIKAEYEIIIVTSTKQSMQSNKENLQSILDASTQCSRATIITLDEDPGLAQARNIGAAAAKSSKLIFSDDDIILTQDITPMIDKLDSGIQSIQPLLFRYADPAVVDSAGDGVIRVNGVYHATIRGASQKLNQLGYRLITEQLPSLRGAFFAVKKDALVDIGGFDGSLVFDFDDVDLGWRLTLAGYRSVFYPDVRVLHRGGRTTNVEASDRWAQRFHLVNHHAIQLKVSGAGAWLFVFARFELFALKHALTGRSGVFKEFVRVNRMLIQRLSAVNRHRIILGRHHYSGRKTFQAMANQRRFPVA